MHGIKKLSEAEPILEMDSGHKNKKIGLYSKFLRLFLMIFCVVAVRAAMTLSTLSVMLDEIIDCRIIIAYK